MDVKFDNEKGTWSFYDRDKWEIGFFQVNGKQIGAVGSKPRDRSPWRFGQSDDFPDGMMWAATTTFSPSRNAPVVYFETKDEAMNYVESWYDLFWE